MRFFLLVLTFPFPAGAFIGSISDPAFREETSRPFDKAPFSEEGFQEQEEGKKPDAWRGSYKAQALRSLRTAPDNFWSARRQGGVFDSLFIRSDLLLRKALPQSAPSKAQGLFRNAEFFLNISWNRPLNAHRNKIRPFCFSSAVCFGDTDLGFSAGPFFAAGGAWSGTYSLYLRLPSSKQSYYQKKIGGGGLSLQTTVSFVQKSGFRLSGISSHSLELTAFRSQWANAGKTYYNEFFDFFSQSGLRGAVSLFRLPSSFILYGGWTLTRNFYGTLLQRAAAGASFIQPLDKNMRLILGLNWGDHVARPKRSGRKRAKTKLFRADAVFGSIGLAGSF